MKTHASPHELPSLSKFSAQLHAAGLPDLAEEALARDADGNDSVLIHVLGPGKAGKSSLINALAGADVAAVGNLPLTWKVDEYRRADEAGPRAVLHFGDGSERGTTIDEAARFCAEEEAAGKAARKAGEVYESPLVGVTRWVDAPALPPGTALVDTPGLSQEGRVSRAQKYAPRGLSVSIKSRERALELLSRADLIVWTMRANLLQSKAHVDLRDALAEQGNLERTVVAVLSHWDRIAPERRAEASAIATDLFGAVVDYFEPAVLKPGCEGYDDAVGRLRARVGALVGTDAEATRARATTSYIRETAAVAARVVDAMSTALANGIRTTHLLQDEARRWRTRADEDIARTIRATIKREAQRAHARVKNGVQAVVGDQAPPLEAFDRQVLQPDNTHAMIADEIACALAEEAEVISLLGDRVELPVVRTADRRGRATSRTWSLGRISLSFSGIELNSAAWTSAATESRGFWEGLGDFFSEPNTMWSKRFRRGVSTWEKAAEKAALAAASPAPKQMAVEFDRRVAEALHEAYPGIDGDPLRELSRLMWLGARFSWLGGITEEIGSEALQAIPSVMLADLRERLREAIVAAAPVPSDLVWPSLEDPGADHTALSLSPPNLLGSFPLKEATHSHAKALADALIHQNVLDALTSTVAHTIEADMAPLHFDSTHRGNVWTVRRVELDKDVVNTQLRRVLVHRIGQQGVLLLARDGVSLKRTKKLRSTLRRLKSSPTVAVAERALAKAEKRLQSVKDGVQMRLLMVGAQWGSPLLAVVLSCAGCANGNIEFGVGALLSMPVLFILFGIIAACFPDPDAVDPAERSVVAARLQLEKAKELSEARDALKNIAASIPSVWLSAARHTANSSSTAMREAMQNTVRAVAEQMIPG